MLDEALELKPGTMKGSETLDSLEGWNSLATISLMSLVDERLDVNLDPSDIAVARRSRTWRTTRQQISAETRP